MTNPLPSTRARTKSVGRAKRKANNPSTKRGNQSCAGTRAKPDHSYGAPKSGEAAPLEDESTSLDNHTAQTHVEIARLQGRKDINLTKPNWTIPKDSNLNKNHMHRLPDNQAWFELLHGYQTTK